MFILIEFLYWIFSSVVFHPKEEEFDPKNLKIKIPKCTYVTCELCKDTYIQEHAKGCLCLKLNGKDQS